MVMESQVSVGKAALTAGLALLALVVVAPFAELYVYPTLVVPGNASATAANIGAHKGLFAAGIFAYLLAFVLDLVEAWALYYVLRPVSARLSLAAATLRVAYALVLLVAVLHLVTVFRLFEQSDYLTSFTGAQIRQQAMLGLYAFRATEHFGIAFFAVHLLLVGVLVLRSTYIPWPLGVLLLVTGAGYLVSSLKPFLFPDFPTGFIVYTFYGELVFMLWLLVRGPRLPASLWPERPAAHLPG